MSARILEFEAQEHRHAASIRSSVSQLRTNSPHPSAMELKKNKNLAPHPVKSEVHHLGSSARPCSVERLRNYRRFVLLEVDAKVAVPWTVAAEGSSLRSRRR